MFYQGPIRRMFFLLLILFVWWSPAHGQSLANRVIERTLSNGLKILMVERHAVPIVAMNITYGVGSVNERPGITGVAHLYEHMAFKGTERLGTTDFTKEQKLLLEMEKLFEQMQGERAKGAFSNEKKLKKWQQQFDMLEEQADALVVTNEIGELYEKNGGVGFNAGTGRDTTSYVISLSSNRLPLWIAIESDRMVHPVLRQFYKEKEVVLEERNRSVESSPSGKLREAFWSAAFVAHPYGAPTLGWRSDIRNLSASETKQFFKTHYSPNNTVIAIVGDIDPKKVLSMLEGSFGKVPSQPLPRPIVTKEPSQAGERRVEVEFDAQPELRIGFHKPAINDPDDTTFDIIDALLSEGRTSRLYKRLVKEKKIAVSVSTYNGGPGGRYPNLFVISAVPRAPHTAKEVEAAIYEELERLKNSPPDAKELEKVLNNIDASLVRSLRSNSGLAAQLAYFETIAGTWRYLLENRDRMAKTSGKEVMEVAKKYLTKRNRTVAVLVPKEEDKSSLSALQKGGG